MVRPNARIMGRFVADLFVQQWRSHAQAKQRKDWPATQCRALMRLLGLTFAMQLKPIYLGLFHLF